MAIIGESFEKYVKEQVDIRQQKLSLRDRDDNIIKYVTSKTSFLRLTSGVDIVNDTAGQNKLIAMGLDVPSNFIGSNLAKDYVLFSANFKGNFTSNVGYERLVSSYGFSSNPEFGLVPPPGIVSADIKSINRGSLREANINIVCHNLLQFKIISALFLKLRYSLLLEWGHTLYFKKDGSLATEFDIPNLSDDFLNKKISTQKSLLNRIEKERKDSSGNYDAFFGVVKNFNWELQENGSYSININAISTGDVIESLKINSNISPDETAKPVNEGQPSSIIYNKSSLHKILGIIKQKIEENGGYIHGIKVDPASNSLDTDTLASITGLKANYKDPQDNQGVKSTDGGILSWNEGTRVEFTDLAIDSDKEATSQIYQYYIKLGTLLRIVESFLLYYDTSKSENPPVFFIDHNFNTNECFTIPKQIPLDPRVSLIPVDVKKIFENESLPTSGLIKTQTTYYFENVRGEIRDGQWFSGVKSIPTISPVTDLPAGISLGDSKIVSVDAPKGGAPFYDSGLIKSGEDIVSSIRSKIGGVLNSGVVPKEQENQIITVVVDTYSEDNRITDAIGNADDGRLRYLGKEFITGDDFIGKTMNIYINIDYIISVLDNNVDNDGNVPLYDFLSNLMNGVKKSLGYINDFEVIYKENINTYYIIDNALLPYKYRNLNKSDITKFNINLLKDASNGGGSFVTNFSLKSELFARIANTIAIGAQANGNTLISNSTAFSEFNAGLVDRFLENKQNLNVDPKSDIDKYQIAYFNYVSYLLKLLNLAPADTTAFSAAGYVFIKYNDSSFNEEIISSFESYIVDVLQFSIGTYTNTKNIPGTGFIPLNLQLTMDGLSGMKIYETFDIDETLLPDEYQNRLRFIIRGVNHKIDSKGWETNIETLSIPTSKTSNSKVKTWKIVTGGITGGASGGGGNCPPGTSNGAYDKFTSLDSTTPKFSTYLFGDKINNITKADGRPATLPTSTAHGARPGVSSNWQSNNAWDIFVKPGTPVYAVVGGKVLSSARRTQIPYVWGQQVTIGTSDTMAFYTHLDHIVVSRGDTVVKGQLIGFIGEFICKKPNDNFHHLHIGLFDKVKYPGDRTVGGPWSAKLSDFVDLTTGKLIY